MRGPRWADEARSQVLVEEISECLGLGFRKRVHAAVWGNNSIGGHNLEIVWSVRRKRTCLGLAKDVSEVSIYLEDWGLVSPFGGGPSRDLRSRDVEAVGPGV